MLLEIGRTTTTVLGRYYVGRVCCRRTNVILCKKLNCRCTFYSNLLGGTLLPAPLNLQNPTIKLNPSFGDFVSMGEPEISDSAALTSQLGAEGVIIYKYYDVSVVHQSNGEDFYLLKHYNGLYVIGIAKGHPLIKQSKQVEKVEFITSLETSDVPKKKRKQPPNSPLAKIHCVDGSSYIIPNCVSGITVDINQRLLTDPSLLTTKPLGEGFIAIVRAMGEIDQSGWVSFAEYCRSLNE